MTKKIKGDIIDSILTFPTVNPTIDVKAADYFLIKKSDNPLIESTEKIFSTELVEKKIANAVNSAIKAYCTKYKEDFEEVEKAYYPHVYAIAKKRLIIH